MTTNAAKLCAHRCHTDARTPAAHPHSTTRTTHADTNTAIVSTCTRSNTGGSCGGGGGGDSGTEEQSILAYVYTYQTQNKLRNTRARDTLRGSEF